MTEPKLEELARANVEQMAQLFYQVCLANRQRHGITDQPKEDDCYKMICGQNCPLAPKRERQDE